MFLKIRTFNLFTLYFAFVWLAWRPSRAAKDSISNSSNTATNYFEGSILMDKLSDSSLLQQTVGNLRRTFKNEFENLQNEIQNLKANQKKIEDLLIALTETLHVPSGYPKHFNENPEIYDYHFNCVGDCAVENQTRAENCEDVMPGNSDKFGIYLLSVPQSGLRPFYAHCRIYDDKRWTVIQRRVDGSVNFYRNWHDYKNGFGDLYGEYWLGLARLHAMTAQRDYELLVYLSDFDHNQKALYYTKFAVASEADGFMLTVGGYIGDIEDSLRNINGKKFSTYDHYDHENIYNQINCAQTFKSAWWYYDCFACSLNGEYFSHSNRKTQYGIFWRDWHGYESLRAAHMAIRPV